MTETCFLHPGPRQLCATYHAPAADLTLRSAWLLCPPLGLEASLAQATMVQLAQQVAARGHAVLRFDPRGTGDSWGSTTDATLDGWEADVATAVAALKERSGLREVGLIGMRLGAAVAEQHSASDAAVTRMVLWNPVRQGAHYLRELAKRHRRWLARVTISERTLDAPDVAAERLGFAFSHALVDQLSALDHTHAKAPPVERLLLVDAPARTDAERAFAERFAPLGDAFHRYEPTDPSFWFSLGAQVPQRDVQHITEWIDDA